MQQNVGNLINKDSSFEQIDWSSFMRILESFSIVGCWPKPEKPGKNFGLPHMM